MIILQVGMREVEDSSMEYAARIRERQRQEGRRDTSSAATLSAQGKDKYVSMTDNALPFITNTGQSFIGGTYSVEVGINIAKQLRHGDKNIVSRLGLKFRNVTQEIAEKEVKKILTNAGAQLGDDAIKEIARQVFVKGSQGVTVETIQQTIQQGFLRATREAAEEAAKKAAEQVAKEAVKEAAEQVTKEAAEQAAKEAAEQAAKKATEEAAKKIVIEGANSSIGKISSALASAGGKRALGPGIGTAFAVADIGTDAYKAYISDGISEEERSDRKVALWNNVALTGSGAAIGAGIGAVAGSLFFGIGAVPGAILGGLIGASVGNFANAVRSIFGLKFRL